MQKQACQGRDIFQRHKQKPTGNDQQQTDENINSIKAEISALEEKLAMQRQLMQRTKLLSPMSGQVLSWDVKQKLIGRSVRPEQQLIEIAKVDGRWVLELDVADRLSLWGVAGTFSSFLSAT